MILRLDWRLKIMTDKRTFFTGDYGEDGHSEKLAI
jgi:hypothetical protein